MNKREMKHELKESRKHEKFEHQREERESKNLKKRFNNEKTRKKIPIESY